MSKLEKLLLKIKINPKQVRFEELDRILMSEGFMKRQPGSGSSHYTYSKGNVRLTIPFRKPYILEAYY
jgi:hypothetical protein